MLGVMDNSKTALQRAFELARSGKYAVVGELRTMLKQEGYAANQLDGPALGRQLREVMRKSKVIDVDQTKVGSCP